MSENPYDYLAGFLVLIFFIFVLPSSYNIVSKACSYIKNK